MATSFAALRSAPARAAEAAAAARSAGCSPPAQLPHPRGPLRKNHNAIARTAGVERSAAARSTQTVYIQMRWYSHAVHHDGLFVSGNRFLLRYLLTHWRGNCVQVTTSFGAIRVAIESCLFSDVNFTVAASILF